MSTSRRSARAFSLFELLLAIALIMALVAAMFGFLWDLLATRKRITDETSRRRAAALLIERVERDLATCVVGDSLNGVGVWGDDTALHVMSRTVPVRLAERGARDGEVFADLERSEYRFAAARSTIEARRYVIVPGSSRERRGVYSGFGGAVHKVRFRYHDGTAWRDSFDSLRSDRLPAAVEVAIWFDPWPGAENEEPEFPEDELDAAPPARLTFDRDAGFDESAFAEASDLDVFDEPRPDRVRVIVVPDASKADEENRPDGDEGALGE